ncbi:hypothetical protein [Actinomadura macrotermitis]|uniref:Uncharacterized protein n=1 Tax=Actinomadura macrotermitis TaxID=2585200 RepID=A0A7K0C0G1_9ACTN|nr:hypothetical protein [Actinomadura macrotermitis]MQY06955.1 hypothetical protein [Actinomadura macrotermitis]
MNVPENNEEFSDEELDRMAGELLPERTLMSLVPSPSGPKRDVQVFYACQSTYEEGTSGLLSTGLLAQGARTTMTCVPAVVAAR